MNRMAPEQRNQDTLSVLMPTTCKSHWKIEQGLMLKSVDQRKCAPNTSEYMMNRQILIGIIFQEHQVVWSKNGITVTRMAVRFIRLSKSQVLQVVLSI
mmetsp:Transcript_6491/g.14841  ORF Transcript_6491/g.14841 Transcript_6491/m.14841 type:complete len:98 (-) Transcript_6491:78-371(-)